MALNDLIETIVAGGLLGIIGQGIRMAVGLKKLSDNNAGKTANEVTEISISRLSISLFIGGTAGALFLLVNGSTGLDKNEYLFSVIAAGYSGADFIEGLFNTYVSKISTTTASSAPSPGAVTPSATDTSKPSSFAGNERDDEATTNL